MVRFCCRVNVCFHILISGWKRGGAGGGGCWCTLTAKKLSYKDTEDFGGLLAQEQWISSRGQTPNCVFFFSFLAFLSSSLRHSALLAGFVGLILLEANYRQLGAVPPGRAQQKKNTPTLPHTSAIGHQKQRRHVCRVVHMRSGNVGECDSDIEKKKKKRRQRNGLPPDGCDKCQQDWFILWRLFRAPTTTTVINAVARDWCNCYAALMNWPRATMKPGAALSSHTWHRDPGEFAAASHSWKTELIPFIYLF